MIIYNKPRQLFFVSFVRQTFLGFGITSDFRDTSPLRFKVFIVMHYFNGLQQKENYNIQLFQLTLSVQSIKLKDKTESLRGIFMNKFIKISHAWRKQ